MGAVELLRKDVTPSAIPRVSTEFESRTLWVTMLPDPGGACHNSSLPLLHQIGGMLAQVKHSKAHWEQAGRMEPVGYVVLRSGHPQYFNLGGDLAYFRACIANRDREALYRYSKLCLDILHEWATAFTGRLTTVSLVQGRALGGGFETALSADFLIAEEQSEFGFPEILFGLFPCTGGMSLLARRIGVHAAERMMTSGKIFAAGELKEMGVIDEICPQGEGVRAVERFIASHSRRMPARLKLQAARYRLAPLDYQELLQVVDDWVECALALGEDDLHVMEMLARMQQGSAGAG